MSFDSFSAFLDMGDHGLYVWLAYAAAVGVVLANVVSTRLGYRRCLRDIRALRDIRMRARRNPPSDAAGNTGDQQEALIP